MNMLIRSSSALLGLWLVACVPSLSSDPSFSLWCDQALCAWEVDQGRIEKAPTWHRSDFGVSLVGGKAQISQFQSFDDVECIRFELLSDAEARTDTRLQLDFNDDGSIDKEWPLPAEHWTQSTFTLRAPKRYHGVRFILRKHSEGHSVLAQLSATEAASDECAEDPLSLAPQGDGAACSLDAECADGLCIVDRCNSCAESGACTLGHLCGRDEHCESGLCRYGVCSTCVSDDDCDADQACDREGYREGDSFGSCQPLDALEERELGQPCARDAQCKHGFTCAATQTDLEPRCGMACEGSGDSGCRADTVCIRIQASDDPRSPDEAQVCVAPADCEFVSASQIIPCALRSGSSDAALEGRRSSAP